MPRRECESRVNRHPESAALLCNSCIVLRVHVFSCTSTQQQQLRRHVPAGWEMRGSLSCRVVVVADGRADRCLPPTQPAARSFCTQTSELASDPNPTQPNIVPRGHAGGRACECTWQRSANFSRLSHQKNGPVVGSSSVGVRDHRSSVM